MIHGPRSDPLNLPTFPVTRIIPWSVNDQIGLSHIGANIPGTDESEINLGVKPYETPRKKKKTSHGPTRMRLSRCKETIGRIKSIDLRMLQQRKCNNKLLTSNVTSQKAHVLIGQGFLPIERPEFFLTCRRCFRSETRPSISKD